MSMSITNGPTDEQIEAAAKTMHETRNPWFAAHGAWGAAGFEIKQAFRESARAALLAAGVAPQVPNQNETKSGNNFVSLDPEKVAEVERAAAARARGEALIEVVQAHRDLHKTYGSTVACRGGIGGQALTSHCGEICYNADAHQEEVDTWHVIEAEAVEFSARAAEYRKAVQS